MKTAVKKKEMAERMKDGYGSGWPEHRKSDRKQKGKESLKSQGKNEGEKMMLGKDGDNRS